MKFIKILTVGTATRLIDLLQVDLLANLFRPRSGRPSDEDARGQPSSRALLMRRGTFRKSTKLSET